MQSQNIFLKQKKFVYLEEKWDEINYTKKNKQFIHFWLWWNIF